MKLLICQVVNIVDMNNELITQQEFVHGEISHMNVQIGSSVITHKLGLKEFNVVLDQRSGDSARHKIVDIEYNMISEPAATKVYLEPTTLIVGQHDIGNY